MCLYNGQRTHYRKLPVYINQVSKEGQTLFFKTPFFKGVPGSIALRSMDSHWLENCMISQSFEPSRGRVAKVLVQKLLRAVEAEKQGLKNRVWRLWPHLGFDAKVRAKKVTVPECEEHIPPQQLAPSGVAFSLAWYPLKL